jgi:hypothetical protein
MHVSSAQEEAILRLGSPEFPRITATAFGSYPCRSFSITSVRDIGLLARELSLCRDLFIGALIDLRSLAHTRLLFILVSRTSLSNRIVVFYIVPAVNEVTRPRRKEWLPCIGMLLHRVETIVRRSALNAT